MDIVEALRQMNSGDFREPPRIYVSAGDAADEIERLRGVIETHQRLLKRIDEAIDALSYSARVCLPKSNQMWGAVNYLTVDIGEVLELAVRGE